MSDLTYTAVLFFLESIRHSVPWRTDASFFGAPYTTPKLMHSCTAVLAYLFTALLSGNIGDGVQILSQYPQESLTTSPFPYQRFFAAPFDFEKLHGFVAQIG